MVKAMRDFAKDEDLRIKRNLQMDKNTIEELCNGMFNPGGATAVYESAGQGISPLACMPKPQQRWRQQSRTKILTMRRTIP